MRVAGLRRQVGVGYSDRTADGLTPEDQLRRIATTVREMVADQYRCLLDDVAPALARHGVEILMDMEQATPQDREHLAAYFQRNVFPVLTPLAVDPAHPFPYISNLSISIAVSLRGADGVERFARVKVPKILPRWIPLPGTHRYLPLEQLIGGHLESLFPGVEILGWHPFRITRNTDLQIDHDEAEDLLSLIQEEVRNRRFAEVSRLEVGANTPQSLRQLLHGRIQRRPGGRDRPPAGGHLRGARPPGHVRPADASPSLDLPELRDPPFLPATPARLAAGRNIFEVIREGDLLLHHPYESFQTSVERFLQQATDDPDVLAIKLTLYRTGGDSSIARMLAHAAERGKQVAVLIELQARFDEENNIIWAQRLEDVGVHVSYGVSGLKTHTKIMLVVRREGDDIRRYVHIGTGNYNPRTARVYTDFGLFSCDPALGEDLTDLFNELTGFGVPDRFRRLLVAPRGMRNRFVEMIRREAEHARAGRPARILAKMNALVDPGIILELYQASQAGVRVDLIVRGICCLRPGRARGEREHPGHQHRRPVPGALAGVLVPERRGGRGLHRLGRLDAAQPGPPGRGGHADRGPAPPAGAARGARTDVGGQPPGVGPPARRHLSAAPPAARRRGTRHPSPAPRAGGALR